MAPQPALHKRFKYSTCALTDTPFLALDVIDREVTEESVAQTLKDSVKSRNPPKLYAPWTWNPQIPDPKQVVQSARKVFAVLAIIGEPQAIGELLEEGIVDSDLPLKRRSDDIDDNVLVSSEGGKEFVSFANWTEDRRVSEFVAKQWVVLAPVLDDSGKHGKLDSQCALSFLEVDPVGNDSSNAVYRGHLHPAHQRGLQMTDGKFQVAAKWFRNFAPFRQEKENLDKIRSIPHHPHLIQHLATFERGKNYYVIFPWASGGNLEEFWNREDSCQRNPELVLWSLEQMLGISEAIQCLHRVNCRHGDLKPENMLRFMDIGTDRGTLVIADVGVSRLHTKGTGMRSEGTTTRATTPAYEAPETFSEAKGPRARRYDMWSLGCILMEFAIWLLEDSKAIQRFHASRDKPFFEFYRHRGGEQEIHPRVLDKIQSMRQDARVKGETALATLLKLISEHLLLIDAESRDDAGGVVEELRRIVENAKRNPEYLMNSVGSVQPTRKDSFDDGTLPSQGITAG